MTKKAPFFSHDMNARHDPKISAMRGAYGSEGYGWFWMLVEMMAESDGYRLDCKSKYSFNAYAMQLHSKPEDLQKFVSDCIDEFELFSSDGEFFWSNSLRNRMQYRDSVAEKRSEAARKRWDNANASKNDANAMQNHANETKQNKTKKPSRQKQVYDVESIPYRSANYLLEKIREHKPDLKEPDIQKWADTMRLLIEKDKREPIKIAQVIDWATNDTFWRANILSADTLRNQWDKLTAKMDADKTSNRPSTFKREMTRGITKPENQQHDPERDEWFNQVYARRHEVKNTDVE